MRKRTIITGIAIVGLFTLIQTSQTEETKKAPHVLKATFAGGCFWCMEPPFENRDGVLSVVSGYTGSSYKNPTYEEVSAGKTGHAEAVQVSYDPQKISYQALLDVFWRNIDPTQANGQFVDIGTQYRSAIFYHNPDQKSQAEESKNALNKSGRFKKPIVTEIVPASTFYPAEDYHQDFYKKNPTRYHQYRSGSGRDQFIQKTWGPMESQKRSFIMPEKSELKKRLTPLQYKVTQEQGTSPLSEMNIGTTTKREFTWTLFRENRFFLPAINLSREQDGQASPSQSTPPT